ncbi:ABC transporter substrate-binding protein [Marinobacter sp.]|jgi:sulfonate transport system substrate-binding protein|uniref:ABC transporter substrate-binding protein n=1 Tax=Marinobacter sp. TaxID=50741 RepID=UPI000C43CA69|nr:ABC transporter substrate-binding protein [Marinobacter sp.]MBE93787.1 sulfonate ABC transporter substrate-binding protein [Marinobacter sp.]|tara:strand:+ start:1922 stop:3289 length:1368 start_codon:yes stop_codon:yes gene_type:complete
MRDSRTLATITLCGSLALSVSAGAVSAETIRVGIGHQSMVTNTVSGGIVLEKLGLLEKHLPTTGKYEDVDYDIVYRDYDSGPPITNQMLAGKLEFGVMGDYPLIVNGAKFQETGKQETRFIAVTGYNLRGTGNGIVVPISSDVQSLADLEGKTLSVPVGSAAWGMTLKALSEAGLSDKVQIVNQSPAVGAANIQAGRIDAHADFCPWSEIMEFRATGRKIYDGSEAEIPTFHGIVVRESYAEQYPEVVEGVLKATLEAQKWIQENPMEAAVKVADWTGVEKEVLYLYFSKGGITTAEASIKDEWVDAMKYDLDLLKREVGVPDLDFDRWVDDTYLRAAYQAMDLDYDALVNSVVVTQPNNPDFKPAEIWFENKGIVTYDSVAEMLTAMEASGDAINATYVYDNLTGLKLFGKAAYLVRGDDGEVVAFLKKADSEQHIANHGGTPVVPGNALAMAH